MIVTDSSGKFLIEHARCLVVTLAIVECFKSGARVFSQLIGAGANDRGGHLINRRAVASLLVQTELLRDDRFLPGRKQRHNFSLHA